jgi:putative chitinase
MKRIFPNGNPIALQAFVDKQDSVLGKYGINASRTRLAYLFGHMTVESAGLRIFEENLNYSAQRLMQVWPNRFPTHATAQPYANNPQKLANYVYGGRMGNNLTGDGYHYRGRSANQLTGQDNYRWVSNEIGIDLVGNPDKAANPMIAPEICAAFWKRANLSRFADVDDMRGATKAWQGGSLHLAEREAAKNRILGILKDAAEGSPDPTALSAAVEDAMAPDRNGRNVAVAAGVTAGATKTVANVEQPEKIVAAETKVDWMAIAVVVAAIVGIVIFFGRMAKKKKAVEENWS